MTPTPWTASDTAGLKEFINSKLGQKWIKVLIERKPDIDTSTTERAALTGAKSAGYESVFAEISNTCQIVAQPDNASAPAIDPRKD